MRTGLSSLAIPQHVAELAIGHRQKGLHRTYDRHAYRSEKARALELWATELTSIVMAPQSSENLHPIAAE
jgi:hypothetical protein